MTQVFIRYEDALNLIQEADVLMFRPDSFIGKCIARYGGGLHSHCGLASWNESLLECVEFREWKGGRAVNLWTQVYDHPGYIDVYRLATSVETPSFDMGDPVTNGQRTIKNTKIVLSKEVRKGITNTARQLTGNEYGWSIINKLFLHYLPGIRLFAPHTKDDDPNKAYVCSTFVSYSVRRNYADLIPNRDDQYTVPSDISRSALLSYLFTLVL